MKFTLALFDSVRDILIRPSRQSLDCRGLNDAMSILEPRLRKTVTRVDLHQAVYQKVGLSRRESEVLVDTVLKEVSDCLERGEEVKLSGFGSFLVRQKKDRMGRNPKTGKEAPIPARRVMVFKPSPIVRQRIQRKTAPIDEGLFPPAQADQHDAQSR
jgi:integration host factor subunit alpha